MAKQKDVAILVENLTAQVGKIGTEVTGLKEKADALEVALENQDNVSPELQTAVDNLKAQIQVVDDLIPDASVGSGPGSPATQQ